MREWRRYRFYTHVVDDYRPLRFNPDIRIDTHAIPSFDGKGTIHQYLLQFGDLYAVTLYEKNARELYEALGRMLAQAEGEESE